MKHRDPLTSFTVQAAAAGVTDDEITAIDNDVAAELQAGVAAAEAAPLEAVEELTHFVYSEAPPVAGGTSPATGAQQREERR